MLLVFKFLKIAAYREEDLSEYDLEQNMSSTPSTFNYI